MIRMPPKILLLMLLVISLDSSVVGVWSFAFVNVQIRPITFIQMPTTNSKAINPTYLSMTKLVYNGKAKDFPAGTPLSKAASQLGVPVKYSCKKGECATCQIRLAGQNIKCCIGKVPAEPRLKSLQEKGLEIRV